MKEERADHPMDPRSTETSSHKWPQNCPLDRKQGLGGWAKGMGSVACREARQLAGRRGEQDTQKLQGGC